MIKAIDLNKKFGDKLAVADLNLTIPPGEFFCFLGPNGAGKTTTIKMLTGLLAPTSGRAVIGGHDIMTAPVEAKRQIGYVPDRPYLYEKLSGRDFMQFTADLFGISRRACQESAEQYFHLFHLTDVADQFIESYSHGMKQKLVLAAQLMHEPRALIVDEPMVGLDPQSSRVIKRLLRERVDQGCAVFLSTHTLPVAEELADRIGVIHRGRLLFVGSIDELRRSIHAGADGTLEDLFLRLTEEEDEENPLEGQDEAIPGGPS